MTRRAAMAAGIAVLRAPACAWPRGSGEPERCGGRREP